MQKKHVIILFVLSLLGACTKSHITIPSVNRTAIDNDTITQYFPPDSVFPGGDYTFSLLCIDNKNNKWVASESGILRFDGIKWTYFNSSNTPVDFIHWFPYSLLSDNNGIIYAFGQGSGIAVYKDNAWKFYKLPFYSQVIHKDPVTNSIYFLFNGISAGLFKYNGGDYSDSTNYTFIDMGVKNYSISDFNVYNNKIYCAENGGIGNPADSNTIGIVVQDVNGINMYSSYPDWVNTNSIFKGFNDLVTTNGSDLVMIDEVSEPNVIGSGRDPDLFYFNGTKWTTMPITNGEGIVIFPNFLTYAKDGSLWYANELGQNFRLVKYANNTFTYFNLTVDSYFNQSGIDGIAIDDNNIKWLVSYGSGLIAFKLQ